MLARIKLGLAVLRDFDPPYVGSERDGPHRQWMWAFCQLPTYGEKRGV
jgi:hypothetical protein